MNRLEARYRRVLRVLPAPYRQVWEEEMVATFLQSVATGDPELDEFAAEYGSPGWSETTSVLGLAVRLRLGGSGAPARSFTWGQAVRLAVLVALLGHAVLGAIDMAIMSWRHNLLPGQSGPTGPSPLRNVSSLDVAVLAEQFAGVAWLLAYVMLVLDRQRTAQLLAALSVPALAVAATIHTDVTADGGQAMVIRGWVGLLLAAVLAGALTAFHRDAPPPRRLPWLAALPACAAAGGALIWLTWPTDPARYPPLDWLSLCSIALLATVAGYAAHSRGRTTGSPALPLALALLANAVLALRAASLLDYVLIVSEPGASVPRTLAFTETAVLLAVTIPLVWHATRTLRRTLMTAPA